MKIISFDEKRTLDILKLNGVSPRKWDKIIHTEKQKIFLSRVTQNGTKEFLGFVYDAKKETWKKE